MARSAASSPPPQPPFWQTRSFRWITLGTFALAFVLTAGWLEKVNVRFQAERRLREDPKLGPLVAKLTALVQQHERSGALADPVAAEQKRLPQAVWVGRVREYIQGRPMDDHLPTDTLYLTDALLLAGKQGRNDQRTRVPVGRRDYVFRGPLPRAGERWLISVWRDRSGNNAIHYAERCEPGP